MKQLTTAQKQRIIQLVSACEHDLIAIGEMVGEYTAGTPHSRGIVRALIFHNAQSLITFGTEIQKIAGNPGDLHVRPSSH